MAVPVSAWWLHRRRVTTPKVSGGLLAVWNSLIVPNAKAAFWAEDPLWTPPGDGNPVSSWRDAGSEGKNAVQATGTKQPDYVAAVAALNNRPALRGDTDDFLQTPAWSSALAQPYYRFIVGSVSMGDYIVDGRGSDRGSIGRAAGEWFMFAGVSAGDGVGDDDHHVFVAYFNGASTYLDVDGARVIEETAGTGGLSGVTHLARPDGLVASSGDIAADFIIPGATLTAAQVTQIEQALGTHYGIAVAA